MCTHNVNFSMQSPWLSGCRFLFAVTCRCLSQLPLLPRLSSAFPLLLRWSGLSRVAGAARERSQRRQRELAARSLGGPWPSRTVPTPAPAPGSRANSIPGSLLIHFEGANSIVIDIHPLPYQEVEILKVCSKGGGPHDLPCVRWEFN